MSTKLHKETPKPLTKTNERNSGQMLGHNRPAKNSAKCLVRRGEIPSPRPTSIDKINDCVMSSERGACVRGCDPPSDRRVHNPAGDTWRAPATCLMCRKQRTKIIDPSPMAFFFFLGLGEEHRTPRATFRPLDHGSP